MTLLYYGMERTCLSHVVNEIRFNGDSLTMGQQWFMIGYEFSKLDGVKTLTEYLARRIQVPVKEVGK